MVSAPPGKRPATINAAWGDVVDTNSFGTHEFMDFIQQIGSQAYVSVNVGSGTPQEAADWLEYMTAAQPTALAKERAANGHPDPYEVGFLGIGNESWGCGGNMTPDYYLEPAEDLQPLRQEHQSRAAGCKYHMLKIAVGPGTAETAVDRDHHEGVARSTTGAGISTAFHCTGIPSPTDGRPRRLRPGSGSRITPKR